MRGALGFAICLAIVATFTDARADERAAAKEHYMKGTKYFDLGRFEDAVKEYEAAYEAIDDPVLLYNIAQAHRLAGHTERAIFFYRSYLRRVPAAKNRAEVELKIDELQKVLDQQARAQQLPPSSPMPSSSAPPTATPDAVACRGNRRSPRARQPRRRLRRLRRNRRRAKAPMPRPAEPRSSSASSSSASAVQR